MTRKKNTDDVEDVETPDVPDNTPTPHVAPVEDSKGKAEKAPDGYAYVVHPKNGERCLVDEKSVPELLADGYTAG
jgi:hypothetical protein